MAVVHDLDGLTIDQTLTVTGAATFSSTVAATGAISTAGLSVTINSDAAAGTDEDPSIVLKGGDGGSEIIASTIKQDSSADLVYLSTGGGAAGTTRKTPTFVLGFPGETGADLDALLRFDAATSAAAARALTVGYYGQEHALEVSSATAAAKLTLVGTGTIGVNNAALDANQMSALSKTALSFGAGGASAVDWSVSRQAADVAEIASGDSLYSVAGNIGIRALSADAQPTAKLSGSALSLGVGGATAVDWVLSRQAADVAEIASGDSLFSVASASIGRRALSADANPTIAMTATGLEFGAGGATATDCTIIRQAANVLEVGSGDSFYAVNSTLGVRGASADANATASLASAALSLGAGGASAVDWTLTRQAANIAELGSGDSVFSVGAASIGRRATTADANPTIALTSTGLELGAGGATATDCTIIRQAANVLEVGSGDSAYVVNATLGVRAASGDANPTASIVGSTLSLGAGGGTAVDVVLSRNAANKLQLASGDTFMLGTLEETVAAAGIALASGTEIIGVPNVVSFAVSFNTADTTAFAVPAGEVWIIHDMWFITAVDWDGNGTFQVGDSNDADGYLLLANASLRTTYDESGGITGWTTGSRGLDTTNRGVYLTVAVTLNARTPRRVGAYSILFDNTPGTSTAGSGTLYMRYTRIS